MERHWTELKAESSWMVFKVMSEFVEGFEKLPKIGPCISIFGSARTPNTDKYYLHAVSLAKRLVQSGFGIITGGGPGIMEAANKGAKQSDGKSVGLGISLPFEQRINDFVDLDKGFVFNFFFVRKVMLVKYAQAFVLFPGGFGTLDELFETLTLMQTQKIDKIPLILFGSDYWRGLHTWISETLITQKYISEEDLGLFHMTDDEEEVIRIID
jgi:hypothetical protein